MSRRTTLVVIALAGVIAAPTSAAAQKPPKRACDLPFLPLIEGNKWTYEPVESPVQAQEKDNEKKRRLREKVTPSQPKKITVEVIAVVQEKDKTTVTLKESYDELVVSTSLVCTKTSLDVDPYSIFFAAQPGGALQMNLVITSHTGHSFTIERGKLPKLGQAWNEELVADIARTPAEGTGAVLEPATLNAWRVSKVEGAQQIDTSSGSYAGTTVVQVELGGNVTMNGPDGKEIIVEIPANTVNFMWFDKKVGAVQFYNSFGHMYQLVETNIK